MTVKRTQDEIVVRAIEAQAKDIFGFRFSVLVGYLDFDHAFQFLKDGVTKEGWDKNGPLPEPQDAMVDYMEFAWGKANDKRGISSMRSIQKYIEWLWLDGDDELWKELEQGYEYYGKPQLIKVCEYLDIDPAKWDDGVRENY